MKKFISILLILLTFTILLCSCKEDDSWKDADINGYYDCEFGSDKYKSHTIKINDLIEKTFIFTSTITDSDTKETEFYISYGTYEITNKIEKDNYIEYYLTLNFIEKNENIEMPFDGIWIKITKEKITCSSYCGATLIKRD